MTTAEQVRGWWQTIADHPRRWCPKCGRRHCWEQAEARAQLITRGLPLKRPADDRSHPTTGEARRT